MKIFTLILIINLSVLSNIYSQDFWEKISGMDSITIYSLAVNSNGDIFAGADTSYGVFRSTDNGDNWTSGLDTLQITGIVIKLNGEIIVTTLDYRLGGGVFHSTDNGNSWTNMGFTSASTSIAINSSGDIFAGTYLGGVFRSTNNGDNWVQINSGITNNQIFSLATNSNGDIFAGTEGGGVFRSTDNGVNWVQINQGLAGEGLYIFSLEVNSGGDIFAGTAGGVFRSTDNGDDWVQINQGLTNDDVHSLAINSNGDIFAGTEGGIFRTVPSANIKLFLQGPYVSATGTMSTALNTNGYIPLTQPYSAAPWNYAGTEAVYTVPAGVVDWVLLELRSDLTTLVSRRAAFLMSNGNVVDFDGVSTVRFPGVVSGNFYVVVHHRNHLAVMTANPVTLSYSPVLYNFGTGQTQAYGTNAMKDLGGGVFGMITADTDGSGTVNAADRSNTWNQRNLSGYYGTDVDLSGTVNAADRSATWNNRNTSTQVP